MHHPELYGHLLDNAVTVWAEDGTWRPGKWATIAALRGIAREDGYHRRVLDRVRNAEAKVIAEDDGAPIPVPALTLRDFVALAFEVALLVYGPRLPFGGYWARVCRDFVLENLDRLFPPRGLAYRAVPK